jgi:hypothetical protein
MGFARAPLQTNWPQGNWSFVYSGLNSWLRQSFVRSFGRVGAHVSKIDTSAALCDTHTVCIDSATRFDMQIRQLVALITYSLRLANSTTRFKEANIDIFISKSFDKHFFNLWGNQGM